MNSAALKTFQFFSKSIEKHQVICRFSVSFSLESQCTLYGRYMCCVWCGSKGSEKKNSSLEFVAYVWKVFQTTIVAVSIWISYATFGDCCILYTSMAFCVYILRMCTAHSAQILNCSIQSALQNFYKLSAYSMLQRSNSITMGLIILWNSQRGGTTKDSIWLWNCEDPLLSNKMRQHQNMYWAMAATKNPHFEGLIRSVCWVWMCCCFSRDRESPH